MKKSGLGKGLSALIPDSGTTSLSDTAVHEEGLERTVEGSVAGEARLAVISVADVLPNQYQPRRIFDDEKMAELTSSFEELGVLQPILVRQTMDGYDQ